MGDSNGECSVLMCSAPAERTWSTGEVQHEFAEWGVCVDHHGRLRAGEDWATHRDLPRSARQWIVMGSDLDIRNGETIQDWRVSVEFNASGRDLRLALTTQKDELGAVLDEGHATELGEALTKLATTTDTPPPTDS